MLIAGQALGFPVKKSPLTIWLPVVALLLIHLLIRSHHITALEPYVDEGSHLVRGAAVWHFETHPARLAHGKLLTYFWLGLFEGPPSTALVVGRLSIALFSTLTAATIYLLGRWWQNHRTGLLALMIYACWPLAFFFERMALADPFAAGSRVINSRNGSDSRARSPMGSEMECSSPSSSVVNINQ